MSLRNVELKLLAVILSTKSERLAIRLERDRLQGVDRDTTEDVLDALIRLQVHDLGSIRRRTRDRSIEPHTTDGVHQLNRGDGMTREDTHFHDASVWDSLSAEVLHIIEQTRICMRPSNCERLERGKLRCQLLGCCDRKFVHHISKLIQAVHDCRVSTDGSRLLLHRRSGGRVRLLLHRRCRSWIGLMLLLRVKLRLWRRLLVLLHRRMLLRLTHDGGLVRRRVLRRILHLLRRMVACRGALVRRLRHLHHRHTTVWSTRNNWSGDLHRRWDVALTRLNHRSYWLRGGHASVHGWRSQVRLRACLRWWSNDVGLRG